MAEERGPSDNGNGDPVGDLDDVASRLDAALERISRHIDTVKSAGPPDSGQAAELKTRLDGLIERLRDALGGPV